MNYKKEQQNMGCENPSLANQAHALYYEGTFKAFFADGAAVYLHKQACGWSLALLHWEQICEKVGDILTENCSHKLSRRNAVDMLLGQGLPQSSKTVFHGAELLGQPANRVNDPSIGRLWLVQLCCQMCTNELPWLDFWKAGWNVVCATLLGVPLQL